MALNLYKVFLWKCEISFVCFVQFLTSAHCNYFVEHCLSSLLC
uniref:Uncharacterized protein n=1 Tax=Rhizophora mucronata TaxID=61149 RepID=A0A2P2NSE0_RHIMU